MRTLVIVYNGKIRGNNTNWSTILNKVVDPLSADLAIFFTDTVSENNLLYKKAKYIKLKPEFLNCYDYLNLKYSQNLTQLKYFFENVNVLPFKRSALFTTTLKDIIHSEYESIVSLYDRIILTRSDNFFIATHEQLTNDTVYVPDGEHYGGVSDRHLVLPCYMWKNAVTYIPFICNNIDNFKQLNMEFNAERLFELFLKNQKINYKQFARNHFLVYNPDEVTQWPKHKLSCTLLNVTYHGIRLVAKYGSEYKKALECLKP